MSLIQDGRGVLPGPNAGRIEMPQEFSCALALDPFAITSAASMSKKGPFVPGLSGPTRFKLPMPPNHGWWVAFHHGDLPSFPKGV